MPATKTKQTTPAKSGADIQLRKEARELRKSLQQLSNAVLLHLHALDAAVAGEKTIPPAVSSKLAQLANELDLANDLVRFGVLGVDFRTDDKDKIIAKLKKAAAPSR